MINSTKKIKNRILAISIEVPATPENPKTPAIKEMIKKVMVHRNIYFKFLLLIIVL